MKKKEKKKEKKLWVLMFVNMVHCCLSHCVSTATRQTQIDQPFNPKKQTVSLKLIGMWQGWPGIEAYKDITDWSLLQIHQTWRETCGEDKKPLLSLPAYDSSTLTRSIWIKVAHAASSSANPCTHISPASGSASFQQNIYHKASLQ